MVRVLSLAVVLLLLVAPTVRAGEPCPNHPVDAHTRQAASAARPHRPDAPLLEAIFAADGARVSLARDGKAVALAGAEGFVAIALQNGRVRRAPLVLDGDVLRAAVQPPVAGNWTAEVEVRLGASTERARFLVLRPATAPAVAEAAPAPVTFTGEVVEAGCVRRITAAGAVEIACARAGALPLVREGLGAFYVLVLDPAQATDLERRLARATPRARFTGRVEPAVGLPRLAATRIVAEHDHDVAPHGGVVGMQGDRHLELVVAPDGSVRVYLLDAFMTPLPVAGAGGSATIRTGGGATREARLVRPDGADFLAVEGQRRQAGDEDVTVDLVVGDARIGMTLPFPPP